MQCVLVNLMIPEFLEGLSLEGVVHAVHVLRCNWKVVWYTVFEYIFHSEEKKPQRLIAVG